MLSALVLRHPGYGQRTVARMVVGLTDYVTVQRTNQPIEQPNNYNLLIRWGSRAPAPFDEETQTFNRINNLAIAQNKLRFRQQVGNLAPPTYHTIQAWQLDGMVLPVVVRPWHHTQGQHFHLCNTLDEVRNAAFRLAGGQRQFYITQYIKKAREYRVFVWEDKAVWVAEKTPNDREAPIWSHQINTVLTNVRWSAWPLQSVLKAVEATHRCGLDFGAVDVIEDQEGNAYVLEANTAPGVESFYRSRCMQQVLQHTLENGISRPYFRPTPGNTWRHYIHPAIRSPE